MQYIPIEKDYFSSCPFSAALLTDFHNSDPDPVLDTLQKRRPDIITIAGDFIFGDRPKGKGLKIEENPRAVRLLQGCAGIAPTFVSLGNHEYMLTADDLQAVTAAGVHLLDNSWTVYEGIFIGGLNSAYVNVYRDFRRHSGSREVYPKPASYVLRKKHVPKLDWLDEFENLEGYKLLLCHHPEYYPLYLRSRRIDLILSGHCHGGQWRFYSWLHKETRGIFAPGQGLFPVLTSGIHDGKLVVSQGLSNTTWVPRINNPTEIVFLNPRIDP